MKKGRIIGVLIVMAIFAVGIWNSNKIFTPDDYSSKNEGEIYSSVKIDEQQTENTEETAIENEQVTLDFPKFSIESGFYEEDFSLELKSNIKDVKIYYTTDGSIPSRSSNIYTNPINIINRTDEENGISMYTDISPYDYVPDYNVDKGTVIRAIVYDKDGNKSDIVTKSYFVGLDIEERYNNFPIVSLVTDPTNLFDSKNGIYVLGDIFDDWKMEHKDFYSIPEYEWVGNYTETGKDWEKPATIEIFENDGMLAISQNIGVRIMGGASRSSTQKSFKLYARTKYSEENIEYNLFGNENIKKSKTFLLRNGGNESYGIKLSDSYIQSLVTDRNYSLQASRPCIAFLNGEYWGVYSIQEDYSSDYIEEHYNVPDKEVVMVKIDEIEEGTDEDIKLYTDMAEFVRSNDMGDEENYNKYCDMMDIDSLIDYFATEIYIDNEDWIPVNNYRLWRSGIINSDNPYQDGKWRWCIYDTEFSMGLYRDGTAYDKSDSNNDALKKVMAKNDEGTWDNCNILFAKPLVENTEFKAKFVNTIMDLANVNFRYETAGKKLDETAALYEPVINETFERFGPFWKVWDNNGKRKTNAEMTEDFYGRVTAMQTFLKGRGSHIETMLRTQLSLSKCVDINLEINNSKAGTIKINSVYPEFSDGKWVGRYFIDYPVTITAIPNDNYTFIGWSGAIDSKETTVTIPFSETIKIMANFE